MMNPVMTADDSINHGTANTVEQSKHKARKLLSRMAPFDEWVARTNPTESERRLYLKIRQDLEKEAKHGAVTEVFASFGVDG